MGPHEMRRQATASSAEARPIDRPGRGRVVRLRPRLRLASPNARPPASRRVSGQGVLIRLDERRAMPASRPTSPDGVWLIVTVAVVLVSLFASRFLR
jgi:hypothetical protein